MMAARPQRQAMPDALRQSCFNHPDREASARCPACGNFFCHECVVEHGSRIICASCLAKETADGKGPAGANVFLRISAMLLSFAWHGCFFHASAISCQASKSISMRMPPPGARTSPYKTPGQTHFRRFRCRPEKTEPE